MRLLHIIKTSLTVVLFMLGFTPTQAAEPPAGTNLTQLLNQYGIARSAVSLDIREVDTQTPILTLNRNTPRNPASAIKLLTTLAALEILGPTFHWTTEYYVDGQVSGNVLNGNLIMVGGGDPYLTKEKLWSHVQALRQKGIDTIRGNLILDASRFLIAPHDRGKFDGKPLRLYNVEPFANLANFSATHFTIEPTGNGISVTADPPLDNLVIKNDLKASNKKCRGKRNGWSFDHQTKGENKIVRLSGRYAKRCGSYTFGRSVLANDQYTYGLFKYLWESSGGQLNGRYQTLSQFSLAAQDPEIEPLVSIQSAPLSETIKGINKFSNNVMAKQLLLSIGEQLYGLPATVETGILGIRSWLNANGIAMPNLVLENGSGLSRITSVTASELSDLLYHGWRSTYRPEFMSSLSLSALDGTMRKRLNDSALIGRARIKTGLINGVRSMAGYLHSQKGRHYSVVMMIDSDKVNYSNGNKIQDAILSWLYQY